MMPSDSVNRGTPASGISTIRDVASHAGVSAATISNFINDTKPISLKTRRKVEAAIAELNFVPNNASRVMRGGRNSAIGFVVPDLPDPFFAEVARGLEDAARALGYVLVACNTYGDPDIERQYVTALAEMRVEGVVVLPASSKVKSTHFSQLRSTGATLVLLGALEGEPDSCSVSFNDEKGGQIAMEHLLSLATGTSCSWVARAANERSRRVLMARRRLISPRVSTLPTSAESSRKVRASQRELRWARASRRSVRGLPRSSARAIRWR